MSPLDLVPDLDDDDDVSGILSLIADLDLPEPTPGWEASGVCAQVDPEVWFPKHGGGGATAKRLCRTCPVVQDCLNDALRRGEQNGVWGGANLSDRRRMWEGSIPPVPPMPRSDEEESDVEPVIVDLPGAA